MTTKHLPRHWFPRRPQVVADTRPVHLPSTASALDVAGPSAGPRVPVRFVKA